MLLYSAPIPERGERLMSAGEEEEGEEEEEEEEEE